MNILELVKKRTNIASRHELTCRLGKGLLLNEVGRRPPKFAKAFDVIHGSAPKNITW